MANQARSLAASLLARARNQWGDGAITVTPDGRTAYVRPPGKEQILVPAHPQERDMAAVRRAETQLKRAGLGVAAQPQGPSTQNPPTTLHVLLAQVLATKAGLIKLEDLSRHLRRSADWDHKG